MMLWMWLGYIIGFVTVTITQPSNLASAADVQSPDASSSASTQIDPELYSKAITHAKTMSINSLNDEEEKLLQQLEDGRNDVEALYKIAQSMNSRNAGDDRITSVQLWHALADGPAAHVLSAFALGFSYLEVDKKLSLQYFIQASQGKEVEGETVPHQAALFNAGRLFLELNDAASSLAYIRGCANMHNDYPMIASPTLTQTCTEAYETLSSQIQSESISPPGIEDAAQMFLYSAMNDFPFPDTKEMTIWIHAMEYLESYATMVREGNEVGAISGKRKGQTYLLAAQQELEQFQKLGSGKMSELQKYLLDIITGRIQLLMTAMEVERDEL